MAKYFKIILLFVLLSFSVFARYDNIKFERLESYKGLATKYVNTILQDDKGFIWFGTQNGLYKYDGYKITGYFHDPANPNSLSSNWIQSLLKDKTGFFWIGTNGGGLNKFNPETEEFIHYKQEPNNPNSLCNNFIMPKHAIYEDRNGNFWIGTNKGLSRIVFSDSQSNSNIPIFTNYYHDSENTNSLSHEMVWSIYEDSESNIWIGTNDGTLHKFDTKKEKIIRIVTLERLKKVLGSKWNKLEGNALVNIRHHPGDPSNILTIALNGYMYKFDYHANTILNHFSKFKELMSKNNLTKLNDVLIDQNQNYWIATNNGCYIIDSDNQQIYDYHWKQRDPTGLAWKHINTFYEDRQGLIWVGLWGGIGIQKCDPWNQNFKTYVIDTDTSYYVINSIFEETTRGKPTLWIGTARNGIVKLNRTNNQLTKFNGNLQHIVTVICQSPHNMNEFFLGTIGKGFVSFDKTTGTYQEITYWKYLTENINAIDFGSGENSIITSLLIDKRKHLWIGSLNGLFKYDEQNSKTTAYLHDSDNSNSISANDISAICESEKTDSVLWVGTRTGGLNKLDMKTNCFTRYQNIPNDSTTLNNNYVSSILEDKSGTLWVGTPLGLNKFDDNTNTFRHILDKDIKLKMEIQSIQEDEKENLWLNTSNGFGKYDKKNNVFNVYTGAFKRWAYYKNNKGEFFYGGGFGIVSFFPDKIKYSSYISPMVLTDFQIFNKPVKIDLKNNSVLNKSISATKEVTLSYDQSVFSFEFALLDFSDPEKNKYAYKMDGVDPDWVYTDASRRFATYTNLDPGEYTFRVKGSNNDGIWNEKGTSVKVIITPPWWQTTWAYTGYLIIIVLALYTLRTYDKKRQRLKQALEMEHFESEKLREVDQLKSHFFANISHEFRTPLTLIKGPVKQLLDGKFAGNVKEQYKMILRNSDRLLGLINQLLDISKLESGRIKLKVSQTDIIRDLRGLALCFSSLAERKKISFKLNFNHDTLLGYIDRDKFEKIITNLLSNAFKFTPERGLVEVSLRGVRQLAHDEAFPSRKEIATPRQTGTRDDSKHLPVQDRDDNKPTPSRFPGHPSPKGTPSEQGGNNSIPSWEGQGVGKHIHISISNTGPGIPADQLDKIFDRFYQAPMGQAGNNYKKDGEGTGIGLALTRELVEACHGEISVSSNPGKNTTFTVTLPIIAEYFKMEEIEEKLTTPITPLIKGELRGDIHLPSSGVGVRGLYISEDDTYIEKKQHKSDENKSAPLILIVEDNPDVTGYIASFMNDDYRIVTAGNGKEGLETALDKYPDLIISDVMMPEMDGFEFCKMVKSDQRLSHIPVILLTAKADPDSKFAGLEFGADDYVTKPFEARELQIRSKNLIEQRQNLRERFSLLTEFKPGEIAASSMDEQLLKRMMTVFEQHMSEPDFSTTELAREVGLSRMHLNRKIQALTTLSTNDFIRTLRLQRAAQLLKSASGTVSEIAFKVGIYNLSYFSKSFRKQFGKLPSEYSK